METTAKAAEMSRRMRILMWPESAAMRRSLVILIKGGLCAVVCSETRLKRFIEQLGGNCSFQDLTEKRKVGDRRVVGPNTALAHSPPAQFFSSEG